MRAWVSLLDRLKYSHAAVFSVSGGGRAIGNRGAQRKVIETLEEREILVTFDEVFVMPSNFFYRVKHPVDAMIMTAYPAMIKRAVAKILAGEIQRTKTPLLGQIIAWCFRNSWKHTHKFGSAITVSEDCTACSICIRTCPVDNIVLNDGTNYPDFSDACVFCLGCLYACPTSALQPRRSTYAVLKDGYNLQEPERRHYDCAEWE